MPDVYQGKGEVYVNGRVLAEAKSVTITVNSNDQQVGSMQKGFAGFSDGAANTEAEIDSLVPRKGFEKHFAKAVANRETITLVVKYTSSDKIRAVGRFTKSSYSASFNGETATNASFLGGAPKFE